MKSEENAYHGQSGDALTIAADKGDAKGTTLSMKLSFGEGDANFNGKADVVDLQAQINYAFENYNDKPFNFTAANLWVDDVINVQDVVKMTDKLLAIDDENNASARYDSQSMARSNETSTTQCFLYIKDGQVWIDSELPIAAFELTLFTSHFSLLTSELKELGFTCRSNSKDGITRMIGYSLSGETLPIGKTAICEDVQGGAEILSAVLSDANAEEIPVRLSKGETTAIKAVENSERIMVNSAYDLQGRRIANVQSSIVNGQSLKKGLYIVNGKKVVK